MVHPYDAPSRSHAEQQAFFDDALARARAAQDAAGARIYHLRIAGTVIRLIFAGPALDEAFLPALAHRLCETCASDVTFHVWDSASTGVAMSSPPCNPQDFTHRGDIWGFNSRVIRSAFHWSEYALNLVDLDAAQGVYWVASPADLPYWSKASPLRSMFHWWFEHRGAHLIHGAVVGRDGAGVLIASKGGAGKSTTALTCLLAGFDYLADDYHVVTLSPEPVAHSLYCTGKVNADQMARFAPLHPRLLGGMTVDDEKAVIFLPAGPAPAPSASMELRAILVPEFGDHPDSRLAPASANGVRHALVFSNLAQLPHAGQSTVDFMSALADRLPGLTLTLGQDFDAVPLAIDRALSMDGPELLAISVAAAPPDVKRSLVSVVIPVFNGAGFLPDAVASVLAQDYRPIEIIIVDDGSTDQLDDAIAGLPTDVRLLRQENAGPAAARNRGVREVSGEFVAFIDADDLWPAGKLASALAHLAARPDSQVVIGHGQLMRRRPGSDAFEYASAPGEIFANYIGAALYRRSVFARVGLFDERLRFGEDQDWFLRAADADIGLYRVEEISLLVRRHERNMTRGASRTDLNPLLLFKKALDRQREAAAQGSVPAPRLAADD